MRSFLSAPTALYRSLRRYVVKPPPKKKKAPPASIPPWYNPAPGLELRTAIASDKPLFLSVPWIPEHTDALIGKIRDDDFLIAPLDLMTGLGDPALRRDIGRFARDNADLYRRMVVRRLAPLRDRVAGIVLTFDWAPVMRVVATVAEELEIPRILVPHEANFMDRSRYYWDPTSLTSRPTCDVTLGWGTLQRAIFLERGYPQDRFLTVGAPKFDGCATYRPYLTRAQFHRLFGLDPDRPTLLFAAQPLDSQTDAATARLSQQRAIADLMAYATARGCNLVVRTPPSKDDVLGPLKWEIAATSHFAIDDANCYLVTPEEAIHHAAAVLSINSTMLFEAVLAGRPALSLLYVDFEPVWAKAGIPAARDAEACGSHLDTMLSGGWTPSADGLRWAARAFGVGSFDGKAAERIRGHLRTIARSGLADYHGFLEGPASRLFAGRPLDVVAIPSSTESQKMQVLLPAMLNARAVVSSHKGAVAKVAGAELFLQWGIRESRAKNTQRQIAKRLGRPLLTIEDGFLRSIDIGLSGEPALSVIVDAHTAYYDATRPSSLARHLQDGPDLTAAEAERAARAAALIVDRRVSKYNHAPFRLPPALAGMAPGARRRVLLVDQRFGDQSVVSGLAGEDDFRAMLVEAAKLGPDWDVIVKRHPDATRGGKESYFNDAAIAAVPGARAFHLVSDEVNPYVLFDLVEEVWVVSSGVGFEALLAGRTVRCFGMPFYAGWGVTRDEKSVAHRTRRRTVTDIFHAAYIHFSRYALPGGKAAAALEDVVEHIVARRPHQPGG